MSAQQHFEVRFFPRGELFLLVEHDDALSDAQLRDRAAVLLARLDASELLVESVRSPRYTGALSYQRYTPPPKELLPPSEPKGCAPLTALLGWVNERVGGAPRASASDPKAPSLPADDPQAPRRFSMLYSRLEIDGEPIDDEVLISIVQQVDSQLNERAGIRDGREPRPRGTATFEGVDLRGVSLNWLSAGGQGQLVVGGPGGHAAPPSMLPLASSHRFTMPHTRFSAGEGAGITVAILDNVPEEHALANAFKMFVTAPASGNPNSLLRDLLAQPTPAGVTPQYDAANRPLRIVKSPINSRVMRCHASHEEEHQNDFGTLHYSYPMPDHGLFAAGIVHSVAPKADLWLIEALNCYGVGTVSLLAGAVHALLADYPRTPLVVNASLMIMIPNAAYSQHRPELREFEGWERLEALIGLNPQIETTTALAINFLFGLLKARGAAVIASAGNEGANNVHPPARLPAADSNVIGVGALDGTNALAAFSNRGDSPHAQGVLTFGGSIDAASNTSAVPQAVGDSQKGVLSVYTSDFYNADNPQAPIPNTHGWAYWSGTSFAAPVVSAAMAVLMSQRMSTSQAEAFIRGLHKEPAGTEDLFIVTQG